MLQRCYLDKFEVRNKSYAECLVCNEWLRFSNFYNWCKRQDFEGKALDKDIVNPGSKEYNPENCRFVSKTINSAIIDSDLFDRELPKGVTYDPVGNRYRAKIIIKGKVKCLGSYKDCREAAKAFAYAKREKLIAMAQEQEDEDIKSGLQKHAELSIEQFKGVA